MDGDRPHGTTVSAFASPSMSPPMLLVALDAGSDPLRLLRGGSRFGVNVLGCAQAELAKRFARKGDDKFGGVSWRLDGGVPRLPSTSSWMLCGTSRLVDGGDHVIALGAVLAADSAAVPPLTYHAREFGTHTTLEVKPA